jgi:hypothetical protein
MSDFQTFPLVIPGGLHDSKLVEEAGDFQRLEAWTVLRGRMSLRAPWLLASSVSGGAILALALFRNAIYAVIWNSTGSSADLYSFTLDGTTPTLKGTIWSGLASAPRVILTPVQGGSSTTAVDRLYCADTNGSLPTRYFVEGTGFTTVQEDLNNDGVKEDVKFQLMTTFMFHVFGTGFFSGTVGRSEVLRFSRPGLIAEDSGSGLATEPREWWPDDYRPIGKRGYRITALSHAGLSLMVFKERESYAFYGFDAQSWQVRQVSASLGCVGPLAAASVGPLCYFWSERGPARTDGQSVEDLSEPVRQHVLDAKLADTHVTVWSPDDGLVYFCYPDGQDTYPTRYLAYHTELNRFVGEGKFPFPVRCAASIPNTVEPGPAAAPSNLVATATGFDTVSLSWTKGDTSIEATTRVERDTVEIATVAGGSSYTDTGRSQATTYAYRVRHERNAQFSAYSSTASVRTPLQPPTGFSAQSVTTGVQLSFTLTLGGVDVVIERRLSSSQTWTTLTTLLNQVAGAITYTDTTAAFGTLYVYRLKVQKTGETESAYTPEQFALAGVSPQIASLSHAFAYSDVDTTFFTVRWTISGTIPNNTSVQISRKFGTNPFDVRATVSAAPSGSFQDELFGYVYLAGYTTTAIQYKAEIIQNSSVLHSLTDTATQEPLKPQTFK